VAIVSQRTGSNSESEPSPRWAWFRVSVVLVLSAVAFGIGWCLRPSAQQAPPLVGPTIAVYATSPGISADVAMTLAVGKQDTIRSNTLNVQISILSALTKPVNLVAVLSNFPAYASYSGPSIAPLSGLQMPAAVTPQPNLQDYVIKGPTVPAITATTAGLAQQAPALAFTITSTTPVGEAGHGSELRVAFPAIVGEIPGDYTPAAFPAGNLFSGFQALLGLPSRVYQPVIQAGTSKFTDGMASLSGYQILAGDPPTLLGTDWTWNGINNATVLAASVAGQSDDQNRLFWSGIFFGVAGAGFITFVFEAIGAARPRSPKGGDGQREATVTEPETTGTEPGATVTESAASAEAT
jgi:hypothetical protein